MPRFATGVVVEMLETRDGLARVILEVEGERRRAVALTLLTGEVSVGDRVVANTTAVDLGLGTGGEDFVLWNLERDAFGEASQGHIMKLRYTPLQTDVMSVEAPESPHHEIMGRATSLDGLPVIVCALHSQLVSATAFLKASRPDTKIVYVMTEGAGLTLPLSDSVAQLKAAGLLAASVTCGQALGGDIEAVNVFSGLLASLHVARADVAIVAPGPGVTGTGTPFGHSGMEQGQSLAAAGALGGRAIAALRISFADPRERHRVVSHHTLAALRYSATLPAIVAVPSIDEEKDAKVLGLLEKEEITERHDVRVVDASSTRAALERFGLTPQTMGRSHLEDPELFEAGGAAAAVALGILRETV